MEDDDFLREEIEHTFKKLGYEVPPMRDFGPEAAPGILELAPDLVILDVNLPGTNGYDLCRWLKGRTTIPVLILTARDTLSDELHALGLGADDFLTKPCPTDRLVARVRPPAVYLCVDEYGNPGKSISFGHGRMPFKL